MNKKRNAFTLIELLAIIVILAIIAVITVPIILNIIENSRKGAATDSAYGYKDAINKWYVTELSKPENQNLLLNGQYNVSTGGVLTGNGIVNKEIPVSGDKPSSGKLHYTNNVLDDGCLVIGDYKITFKSDGSVNETVKDNCDDYVVSGGSVQAVEPLEIGDSVAYSTTLNTVTLDNWKVFYIDGDYTYLILDGYLPNAAISDTMQSTYNLSKQNADYEIGIYSIKSSKNRADLLNAMTTTSNWADLINNGKINGTVLSTEVKRDVNVWAMGAPDIELWVNSWNAKYPSDTLYTAYSADVDNDGYDGWYIGDSANPTIKYIDLSSENGYNDTLYYPHQEEIDNDNCYGYWLASPSACGNGNVSGVSFEGYVNYDYYYSDSGYAFRPVIKLPSSVVNQ